MKSAFVCLLSVLLLQIVYGQTDCEAQFNTAKQCARNLIPARPAGDRAAWTAMKARSSQCFSSNGCEDPAKKHEQVQECLHAMHENQVKPKLESCVQAKIPGFQFPENHGEGHGFHGGLRGGKRGHFGGKDEHNRTNHFDAMLLEACPSQQAADAVKSCLQELRPPHQDRAESQDGKGPGRDAFKQCFAQITDACKEQEREKNHQNRDALCECYEQRVRSDVQIQAAVKSCLPADAPNAGRFGGQAGISGRMFGGFCHHKGGEGRRQGAHPST